MAGSLEGKVAFITGVARGQGRSHAVTLAREGCDIIGIDVCRQIDTVPYPGATADDLAETIEQVEALDRRCLIVEGDVRDLAAQEDVVKRGVAEFGRLDIVLANAGIASYAPLVEMSEQMWSEMIDVNLTGVWKTMRATVPHLIAGGRGGAIVITSSIGAWLAYPNTSHYGATKAGVVAMARVLSQELAPHWIRVNTVNPTTVSTEMVLNEATFRLFQPDAEVPDQAGWEAVALTMNALPIAAIDPIDVSNAILYLVSDAGRYVTGATHEITAGNGLS